MKMNYEIEDIRENIKSERQYFASILSDDDLKRFKDYTFTFGLLLMHDALMGAGTEQEVTEK